jgi:hypothetical protein
MVVAGDIEFDHWRRESERVGGRDIERSRAREREREGESTRVWDGKGDLTVKEI